MSSKSTHKATQPQSPNIARLMCLGALFGGLLATSSTSIAQLPAPLPAGVPTTSVVSPSNEPKLVYKAPGSKLTVEELELAQQKKLEEDYFKKAGYTSTLPVVVKPIKANAGGSGGVGAGGAALAAPKPVSTLFISGIYGTDRQQKAEVVWNGVTRIVETGAMLGNVTIESIEAGKITVMYTGKAKAATENVAKKSKGKTSSKPDTPATALRQTLKAGEILEIPA